MNEINPNANGTKQEMLSVNEVAKIAGVSNSTIRNWINCGRLPAHRYGERLIRILRLDLEKFIESSKTNNDRLQY